MRNFTGRPPWPPRGDFYIKAEKLMNLIRFSVLDTQPVNLGKMLHL